MTIATDQTEFDFSDVVTNVSDCPSPGIYRDVPFEEYASWRAINSGVVRYGEVSQLHFRAAYNGEISNEDTQSRKFGRAVHTRLLEPEQYAERVLISQPCCELLKSGDRKGQPCCKAGSLVDESMSWFCGTHKPPVYSVPKDYVSREEFERIERMAAALHEHPAMALLKAEGWSECSCVFEHDGLLLKGRIDRYSRSAGFILDVKKMRVGYGTMELCRKAIDDYKYMTQMAIYRRAIEMLDGIKPRCLWLMIEEAAPFAPQIIEAEDWELDHAWSHVAGVLNGYKNCLETGKFDGYVKFDNGGNIISTHKGGYPLWKAKAILEGRA